MNEERWFSYPIWFIKTNYEHHDELLEYCLHRKTYDKGRIKSNAGGWQSSNLFFNTDETMKKFCLFLQPYVNSLSEKIGGKLLIDNLWININGFNSRNLKHSHPNSYISGIFYVKSEKNQGDVCFESPLAYLNNHLYPGANFIDNEVYHQPSTGKLIMFPSFLPHSVLPNETNIDRISIAFNLKKQDYND